MFGMGFFEIFVVLVIAVIFLGPEKLPQALVDVARFLKAVKKTLDEAKNSLDKELNLQEFKQEALDYKNSLDALNKNSSFEAFESILDHKPKEDLQQALNAQSLENKAKEQAEQNSSSQTETSQQSPKVTPKAQAQEISYKDR